MRVTQRCAIIFDGANCEISIQKYFHNSRLFINFDVLLPKLVLDRELIKLIYVTSDKRRAAMSDKLKRRLRDKFNGIVIASVGNEDMELAISSIEVAGKVDTIIIVSGDGDYVRLAEHLKTKGCNVEIASVKGSTSGRLVDISDRYYKIKESDVFDYTQPQNDFPNPTQTNQTTNE